MTLKKICEKIESLGNRENLASRNGFISERYLFPEIYEKFSKLYGSFDFESSIVVKGIEEIPVIGKDNYIAVGCIYNLEDSLIIHSDFVDQLPALMMPICDSEHGDLICISLHNDSYGKIFYWDHEGFVGEDIFLVSNSFEEFVMNLEIEKDNLDKKEGEATVTKVSISKKFIDLLNKDGFYPRENITGN